MTIVDELLSGAIDLHTHSGPSPMPRRIDHVDAARQAADAGFRAILVKCHYHDTVTDVLAMEPQLKDIPIQVFGGIALNSANGGLNVHGVDRSLRMGGRMIWFPTISSGAHIDHSLHNEATRSHFTPLGIRESEIVEVRHDDGSVVDEVKEIITMAKDARALVSTGHLGSADALAVVTAAAELDHTQIIVSHPNFVTGIPRDDIHRMVEMGAVVEHEVAMYDKDNIFPTELLVEWIREIGAENTVLGSDLGQQGNQLPMEGYRSLLPRLLELGVTADEIRLMVNVNPGRLIALD